VRSRAAAPPSGARAPAALPRVRAPRVPRLRVARELRSPGRRGARAGRAAQVAAYDDPQEATVALVVEAYRLWLQYETRTDDITAIVIQARCARVPVWPGSRAALHVSAALLLLGGLQPALCCSAHMTCRVHAPSYQGTLQSGYLALKHRRLGCRAACEAPVLCSQPGRGAQVDLPGEGTPESPSA